jgi:hypothetical protein
MKMKVVVVASLDGTEAPLENGEYTAVNSVVVCVRKRVKEEE